MRYLVLAAATAAFLVTAGAAAAKPDGGDGSAPPPAVVTVTTTLVPTIPPAVLGGDSGRQRIPPPTINFPAGCRDVDIVATQKSFLFHVTIYKFHQLKHWCWRAGVIYDERHAWSFDGSSTACLDTVYPANSWLFVWWHNKAGSGHYSEERAHATNCLFHVGDWKEFYPDVKIWSHADGSYQVGISN